MTENASLPRFDTLYPATAGDRPFTAESLWEIPRVGQPVPSPTGDLLAVPVKTYDVEKNLGRTRIWLVGTDGGEPRALTSAQSDSTDPAWAPDGSRLAFVRKPAKDEPGQIHVMCVHGGEPEKLTDFPLGATAPRWLPDGSGIVCQASLFKGHLTVEATAAEKARRKDDPVVAHVTEDRFFRFWDRWLTTGEVPHLFVVDPETGSARDLIPDSEDWFGWMNATPPWDVSPDGSHIAFTTVFVDGADERIRSAVFTVPITGGRPERITCDDWHAAFRPRYAPSGDFLVFGVREDPTFYADRSRLHRFDTQTGETTPLLTDWELSPEEWTFAGDDSIVLRAQIDGRTCLFRLDGTPTRLTGNGTTSPPAAGPDGRLYFTHQSLVAPAEVFSLDGDGGRGDLSRLTHFTDEALTGVQLSEVRDVRFTGAEGQTVQMYLLLPPGHDASEKSPLVHVVHGGPHGISGDSFHPRWNAQLFAAPGYVAACVNFQGSTSWGQDFAKRIQGLWGDRPYRDVMAATDVLVESGLVDESRMAAAGGSYGGYMVSWIATQTDRFRCVVNHAGVFDLLSQYASDVTQGRSVSFGGEPWDGIEGIDRYSPSRAMGNLTTPMLVIHGELDYRVPVTQGLECYNMLKAKGVPARLVYFPDENHWVLKPRNSLLWHREVHDWLARFLGPGRDEQD